MAHEILRVENLSKQYRLGTVGTGTLSHDLNRWWHRMRGLEDPYARVGSVNNRDVMDDAEYVWALRDVSFSVKEGDVLGIIGKNGAGKSTLLKLLSRITSPSGGSIRYRGRIASLLEVGTGFHPELTGRENIYLNGAILGMTKREISAKLDEIIAFSGVAKYVDTPTKRYSSGMTVRLGFAIAAFLEPEILIVDEVLAVGDADFQEKCIQKMNAISREGRTILFVSHNMTSINKLCNRGMVLNKGGVEFESADIEQVTNRYLEDAGRGVDLSAPSLREGRGNLRLVDFYLENNAGERVSSVVSGTAARIYLVVENKLHKPLNEGLEVRVLLRNRDDFTMSMLHSRTSLFPLPLDVGRTLFEVLVPKWPFVKDDLFIDVAIRLNNVLEDRVANAFKLHVVEGEFFPGADFLHPKFFRGVLMEQSWRIVKL